MYWQAAPYLIPLGLAAILAVALAVHATHRRNVPGAIPFGWLMIAMFIWTAGYFFELASVEMGAKLFWAKFEYLGILLVPPAWFSLTLQITNRSNWLTRGKLLALAVLPAITLGLVWTNGQHGLIWSSTALIQVGRLSLIARTFGTWLWVNAIYSYLLIGLGLVLLLRALMSAPRFSRGQLTALITGMALPLTWNVFYLMGVSPLPHVDITPFVFNISALILTWGLFRFRLFDLVPVARDIVIENMREGVVVVDDKNRLVDINPVAERLLGLRAEELIGRPSELAFMQAPELLTRYKDTLQINEEIALGEGEDREHYEINISPIYERSGRLCGRLAVWTDITARKQAEETLERRDAILEAVSFAAGCFLSAQVWRECIPEVLLRLGKATGVNRVSIYENKGEERSSLVMKQIYTWNAPGADLGACLQVLDGRSYRETSLERWQELLEKGEALSGSTADFPDPERQVFADQPAFSLVLEPVYRSNDWWGFIAFTASQPERSWSRPELEALRTAADTLGAAIHQELAQEALRISEQRHLQLVEVSPNPVFSVSADGRIRSWNRACQQFFQYGQEMIGRDYQTLLLDDKNRNAAETLVEQVFKNRTMVDHELVFLCKDGSTCVSVTRLYPLLDEHGAVQRCVFANTDITERKSSEQALRRQLEELTVLHAIATAGTKATDEDTLIERFTQIIGETFFPDNFGVLLFDESENALRHHNSYRTHREGTDPAQIALGQGVCGTVAQTGKPVRIPDVRREPRYLEVDSSTRSEVCVPIKVGERLIGVINAESAQLDAFTGEDERLLMTAAGQLAMSIARLRATTAELERANQLAILTELAREMTSLLDIKELCAAVIQRLMVEFDYFNISIFLVDPSNRELVLQDMVRVDPRVLPGEYRQEIGVGVIGRAAESMRVVLVNDTSQDLDFFEIIGDSIRSELAIPLKVGERSIGVLNIDSEEINAFDESEVAMLTAIADQFAITLEKTRLFEETRRRAGQQEALNKIIATAAAAADLDSLLETALSETLRAFDLARGWIWVGEHYRFQGMPETNRHELHPDILLKTLNREDSVRQAYERAKTPTGSLADRLNIKSSVTAPVLTKGVQIGGITLVTESAFPWSADDLALLEAVGQQVGGYIERISLLEETQQRLHEVTFLSQIIAITANADNLIETLEMVCEELINYLHVTEAGFLVYDGLENSARVIAEAVAPGRAGKLGATLPISEGSELQRLIDAHAPVALADVHAARLPDEMRVNLDERGIHALLLVPVMHADEMVGILGISDKKSREFTTNEVSLMQKAASQISQLMQRLRLFEETRRRADHLEALNTIIAAVAAATDQPQLLELALDQTLRALRLQMGGIWVGDRHISRAFPPEVSRETVRMPGTKRFDLPDTVVVRDWERIGERNPLNKYKPYMQQYGIGASITVPIMTEGRRIGGLSVAAQENRNWLEEDIALVEGVGRQLGGAVERIALLEKVQDHARQVQQIMDTVPEGVILLDASHQILLANPAARRQLNDLAVDSQDATITHLGDRTIEELLRIAGQGSWQEFEIAGDMPKVFEFAAQPLQGGENPGGWVLVIRDVTKERENQARIQMQERLATVGQLAAGIAHDFNNILAAIVVYADLLKRDPNLPATSRERLTVIKEQVQRAASLIRQILDFSRRSVMEQSTLDLLPFIKEIEKLLGRLMPETINLSLSYQEGDYLVNADPTRLQQVLMNLAVNARDAMPQGGMIHFELDRFELLPGTPPPCADLPLGEWVRITVRDSGSGIAAEIMPHIFEPFFTTKAVGEGTGLGLAQAYGIVKQHGGHIDVHSQVGEGSTFHIYLNPIQSPEASDSPPAETIAFDGHGQTVLVAEDDLAAREALQTLLEAYNYRVLQAPNGRRAAQLYEENRQDIVLVVSDLVMPEMGGIALYHTLQRRWPDVRMLFVTGHPLDDQDHALLERGEVHWLQKPFTVHDFHMAVQQILHEPGLSHRPVTVPLR